MTDEFVMDPLDSEFWDPDMVIPQLPLSPEQLARAAKVRELLARREVRGELNLPED
jgi:hypothetical protein